MITERITIEGIENVPAHGPMIIATNHVHWWELLMFGKTLLKIFRLSKSKPCLLSAKPLMMFHPVISLFTTPIYLNRNNSDRDQLAIERAIEYLKQGQSLIISPEGKHNKNKLIGAKTGVALIAIQSAAPVVPVALFNKTIKVGSPIEIEQTGINTHILTALTEKIMQEIARLLPETMRGIYQNKG